jgi:hypothetical protein
MHGGCAGANAVVCGLIAAFGCAMAGLGAAAVRGGE